MIQAAIVASVVADMRLPRLELYGGDWLRDPVAGCSLAAQGLWFRMMLTMHDAKPYGHLVGANGEQLTVKQYSRQCGCSSAEAKKLLVELESVGVPGRTSDVAYGQILSAKIGDEEVDLSPLRIAVAGVVYSRRMLRDHRLRVIRRLTGALGHPNSQHLVGQRTNQNADTRARAGADNDNDIPVLTFQQESVKQVLGALEEHVHDFLLPSGGRVAKWVSKYGLTLILETIAQEGVKLDHKNPSYLQQVIESRQRSPHGRTNGNGTDRRGTSGETSQAASGTRFSNGSRSSRPAPRTLAGNDE